MSKGILITLIAVLVLALGIETGYLVKSREVMRAAKQPLYTGSTVLPMPSRLSRPASMSRALFDDWDPFREMEQMQRTMNRMFQDSFSRGLFSEGTFGSLEAFNPDIDLEEKAHEYVLRVDLPGIDKDKINVKVRDGQVIVSGERQIEQRSDSKEGGFHHSERSFGSFMRSMPLPADADADQMTAESANGVLTVRIPKKTGQASAAEKEVTVA